MTPEQIREWLQSVQVPGADRGFNECTVSGPVAKRDNSLLFRARCSDPPASAAVKLCLVPRTSRPDPQSAQLQFDALLRTAAAMGAQRDYAVPQPFLVDAEKGLLAVEWIAGATLTEIVFSRACPKQRAAMLMQRAGRWLDLFHSSHPLPPARLDIEDKLQALALLEQEGVVVDTVFLRGIELLGRTASAASAMPLRRSWLHGDFKSDNVMISGERTIGIDVHLRHENAVVYDLAPFLNHVELRLFHPSAWRLLLSRDVLHRCFLSGYSNSHPDTPELPLNWVRMYLLLGEWRTAHGTAASRLKQAALDVCYRRVASRLCRAIAQC